MGKYLESARPEESELRTRLAQQEQRFEDLTRVAWSLTSILNLEQVLAALMDVAVRMVGAEVGGIFVRSAGKTQAEIAWGMNAEIVDSIQIGDSDLVTHVSTTGKPVILKDQTVVLVSTAGQIFINALLAVPIVARERTYGVLVLVNPTSGENFTDESVETARVLVGFAAVAIENSQLLEERLAQQKVEQQLAVARTVQTTLLPPASLELPGLHWRALYVPAFQIGGDYYDLIQISEDEVAIVVADVSNKGIPAALMMTAVRSTVRSEAYRRAGTARIISRVNEILCSDFTRNQDMYVTLFYAYLNLTTKRMVYTNAGHLAPLLWQLNSPKPRSLKTGGIILGQFDDFDFKEEELALPQGWRLTGFTDGVTERESVGGELFGSQRVEAFVRTHGTSNADTFLAELKGELDAFSDGCTDQDDLTLLWVGEATDA